MSLSRCEFHPARHVQVLALVLKHQTNVMLSSSAKVERGEGPEGEGRHVGLGIRDLDPVPAVTPSIRRASKNIFALNTRLTAHHPLQTKAGLQIADERISFGLFRQP